MTGGIWGFFSRPAPSFVQAGFNGDDLEFERELKKLREQAQEKKEKSVAI